MPLAALATTTPDLPEWFMTTVTFIKAAAVLSTFAVATGLVWATVANVGAIRAAEPIFRDWLARVVAASKSQDRGQWIAITSELASLSSQYPPLVALAQSVQHPELAEHAESHADHFIANALASLSGWFQLFGVLPIAGLALNALTIGLVLLNGQSRGPDELFAGLAASLLAFAGIMVPYAIVRAVQSRFFPAKSLKSPTLKALLKGVQCARRAERAQNMTTPSRAAPSPSRHPVPHGDSTTGSSGHPPQRDVTTLAAPKPVPGTLTHQVGVAALNHSAPTAASTATQGERHGHR